MPVDDVAARPPLRADAERNRRRVLAAARRVFAVVGVDASLDEIAREAGVGVGTLYRRFPNREALIDELFADRMAEVVRLATAALEVRDPWAAFCTFVESAAEEIAADAGLHDVMLCTAHGADRVAAGRDRLLPVVGALVTRAQEAGVLRADFQPQEMPVLMRMIGAAAKFGRGVDPQLWRRYVALLLDGLAATDRPRPALPRPPLTPDDVERAMGQVH